MKNLTKIFFAIILLTLPTITYAEMKMDHSKMKMGGNSMVSKDAVMGKGTVNSIDIENRKINITHEPIPALKWPAMTMDFAVTKKVDLSKIKTGNTIGFHIKLGRDKVYRITKVLPLKNND